MGTKKKTNTCNNQKQINNVETEIGQSKIQENTSCPVDCKCFLALALVTKIPTQVPTATVVCLSLMLLLIQRKVRDKYTNTMRGQIQVGHIDKDDVLGVQLQAVQCCNMVGHMKSAATVQVDSITSEVLGCRRVSYKLPNSDAKQSESVFKDINPVLILLT